MKTLIIDTSSPYCFLAIVENNHLCAQTLFLHENRLSHTLHVQLGALLKDAHLSLQELEQIAVGVGPGSYTGTRVGVIVARSLSYALKLPLKGFCSLIPFLPPATGSFTALLPAKSGLYFLLAGEKGPHTLTCDRTELVSPDELRQILHAADFVTAHHREDVPTTDPINFLPLQPDPHNFTLLHSFEQKAELIYLNPAHS